MKNNKKKQLPLLLLALLFITTAAYGTRAYFTDNASQEADIKLSLGNLSIAVADDTESEWTYFSENEVVNEELAEEKNENNEVIYTDVQPGDGFTRTFTFQNKGSLAQVVTMSDTMVNSNKLENTPFNVTVEVVDFTDSEPIVLKPNQKISFKVSITVPGLETLGEYEGQGSFNTTEPNTVALDYLSEYIKVDAIQTK